MAAVPSELRSDVDACKALFAAVRLGASPAPVCDRLVAMIGKSGLGAAEVVSYLRDAVPVGADKDRVTLALKPYADAPALQDYRDAPAKEAAFVKAEAARAAAAALQADLVVVSGTAEEIGAVGVAIEERAGSVYWSGATAKLPELRAAFLAKDAEEKASAEAAVAEAAAVEAALSARGEVSP